MENYKYKEQEFETLEDVLSALNKDLETINLPCGANHKSLGPCQLTELTCSKEHILITLKFAEYVKKYSLGILLKIKQFSCEDTYFERLVTYQNAFEEILETHKLNEREAAHLRYLQEIENKKTAKEAEKLKQQEAATALRIKKLKPKAMISEPRTYFETIGWLARNVSTVSASIRSDYESWFVQNFGDAPHSVISVTAKTRNGDPMKYSISFKASLKTEAPATLQVYDCVKKRSIDSVEYIWELIEKYGFKFGKSQDIQTIRACIPVEYLSEFETGYGVEPEPKKVKSQKIKSVKMCA